ncbi:MAG: Pr6Pr family membrane protein [Lacisediminihabitans sp.]
MRPLFAVLRIAAAVISLAAVAATFFDTAARTAINPFNFFGFFTVQSNIFTAIVLLAVGVVGISHRKRSAGLNLAFAAATTYIVVVGMVYNTLLVGQAGGIDVPWANTVLHVIVPIYVAVDWLLFGDRRQIPFTRVWIILIYPVVWLLVVLLRGATDGWVPYPFLAPATGYGSVAVYCVIIAAVIAAVGLLVLWYSRVRVLKP